MLRRCAIASALGGLFFLSGHVFASEPDRKRICVEASEQAQAERRDGKLMSARDDLVVCAQEKCPAVVKEDCAKWLAEVEAAIPTVSLGARTEAGADIAHATFWVDGVVSEDASAGKVISLDPGVHKVRVEANGETMESEVVARAGEKNRAVTIVFAARSASPVVDPVPVAPAGPAHASRSPWPFILGGIGIASLGAFTYFAVSGINDRSELNSTCAPHCAQSDVDSIRTKFIVADITGVVGVASLGAAAWLWFSSPKPSARSAGPTAVGFVPLPAGGAVTVSGSL